MRKATCKKENQTAGVKFHKLYAWYFILFASICGLLLVLWLVGCGEDYWEETEDLLLPEQLADEADDRAQEIEDAELQLQILATAYANAIDVTNRNTRDLAVKLAAKFPGERNFRQVCAIYDHLYRGWSYVSDPRGLDYVSPASRTIELGFAGDCDDFAVLLAALIECIGGTTRVVLGYGIGTAHVYAEVYLGGGEAAVSNILEHLNDHYRDFWGRSLVKEIHFHVDASGARWLNLDWTSTHPGGPFFDAVLEIAFDLDGDYDVAGVRGSR